MYIRLHLVIVFNFLLLIISGRSLIAQQNQSNLAGENYLDNVTKLYEKMFENDSTNYDALTNLGVIFQQNGDLEKSLRYFQRAVKFHPKKARAYHNLGILNSLMGRYDDAFINLNKAAELDTTSPNSIRQLGILYLQNNLFIEAIEAFNRALSRDNLDTESYIGKALAYWSLKNMIKFLLQ